MKEFPFNDDPSNRPVCREEENDPVWRLLGESPRPEPDAWLATRTLARCREAGAVSWRPVWRWALGGGLGLCLAMVLMLPQVQHPVSTTTTTDNQQEVQKAFEIVASLDASDSDSSSTSSTWQDSSL